MRKIGFLIVGIILLLAPVGALAQSYSFSVDRTTVDVYLNDSGTIDVLYRFTFRNDPSGAYIDFVDVGMPNKYFSDAYITAEVDGAAALYVSSSEYQAEGTGAAVALGDYAIPPGATGTVTVWARDIERMFHPDSEDPDYASMVFSPTWFDSDFVHGDTDLQVSFHMPEGVQPQEPRWHSAPPGWASEPQTSIDDLGRVTYTWRNATASAYKEYDFGASLPRSYLPAGAIYQPNLAERLGISPDDLIFGAVCAGFVVLFGGSTVWGIFSTHRRKQQYLPPKITVEGHGIKRGLTAVEAAILMEQPMDKILTMILFSAIKKGAVQVKKQEPLELQILEPAPQDLQTYEQGFLDAFRETKTIARKKQLQETMIALVKSVSTKMKGFSYKETLAYYKSIVEKAWTQVETAATPEVKSAAFDENIDWTMLDRDYDDRTRRTFSGGPVFVPNWWGRYDPTWSGGSSKPVASAPSSGGSGGGGGVSLPNLPGSDFAASMVRGVEGFSAGVVGNIGEFTGNITSKTNPIPASSSSGRSSGGGCACACACAGCACACAGGGR